ncbi:ER membrane protein [Magnaporthiopsis poae ATCC 64411]|uniref:ER membrane protein n=1 Tax=Magnaporthiopsis poae (strain ATCC 64411 / 73-15) TaxID=644358 RepID=A0A0C4DSI4_MAGP6|nr:ER membrane protein [Magnaporthiopsis poae ATCC 64411]
MLWLFRVLFGAVFLLSIVLSIPIAFDVGGRDAGLAYSLSLFAFYLLYSSAKLLTPERGSHFRAALSGLLRLAQWVVIPTLLIWALSRFSVDDNQSQSGADWVKRTLGRAGSLGTHPPPESWRDWFFGQQGVLETVTLGGWDRSLSYSSPVFQLFEGFCSLLVIQAAGQITRWLVNRGRSDTWIIVLLVFSASVIASAVYFLWRVVHFPQISNGDATLIGVTMTTAFFLGAYGISSGRGNPVESSLLFAYIVLCVYQIFTDYMPSWTRSNRPTLAVLLYFMSKQSPVIMASYSTLLHMLGSLPSAVNSSLTFLYAAFQTITPSVIISLAYRITVFYCATRIIPAVRESGARALMQEPSFEDADAASKLFGFLSWFSPSILIAVYTSLLLQHFSVSGDGVGGDLGWTLKSGDAGGNVWRWVNVGATMSMYAVELYLGSDDPDTGMTAHWKSD